MIVGGVSIVVGLALLFFGVLRLMRWQSGGDDSSTDSDWYDSTAPQSSSEPRYPISHFFITILGPILWGAILVVFGLFAVKVGLILF